MAGPQELLQQFQNVTNGFLQENKNNGVIKFLQSTIKTLESVTKRIDAFLKTKNIDVKDRLQALNERRKGTTDSVLEKLNQERESIKSMGIVGFLRSKAKAVGTKLSDQFQSDTEVSGAPPGEDANDPKEPSTSVLATAMGKLQGVVGELTSKIELLNTGSSATTAEVTSSTSSGVSDYQASLQQAKERAKKRADEIEAEKQAVKEKGAKPKGKGGWLSKILGGLSSLGGMIIGGMGKIALSLIPGIGKSVGWVLGKTLSRLAPSLSKGIARYTKQGLKGAVKGGARLLTRAVLPAAWAGIKGLGAAALGAIGTTGLVIAGGVVAAGLLIYGGYKLYKYLNRNNIDKDIFGQLTRLRLLMYGFNDSNKEHYYRLLELEMLMQNYVQYRDGKVTFVKFTKKFKDEVLKLFEVTYEEKEKYQILNTWLIRRFLPSLKAFLEAFMPLGPNLYLDKLDKLNPKQTFTLASKLIVPTAIFDHKQIPAFDNPSTVVTKQEVDTMLVSIRDLAKKNTDELKGKDPAAMAADVSKTLKTNAAKEKMAATQVVNQVNKTTQEVAQIKAAGTAAGGVDAALNPDNNAVKPTDPSGNPNAPFKTNAAQDPDALPFSVRTGASTGRPAWANSRQAAPALATDTPHQEGEAKAPETPGAPASGDKKAPDTTNPSGKVTVAPGPLQPGDQSLQGIAIGPKGSRDRLFQMDPTVFKLFTGMAKEFNTLTGKNITVNESFRTYNDQMQLRKKYGDGAAKPGNSIHEFGMAIDTNTPEADLLDKTGLLRKYGFTRPVGGETWHLEPAGVAVDPTLAKKDPKARQQAILSSPGRGGGGYGSTKSTPLGKRNLPLQKKLYSQTQASTADVASLIRQNDSPVPTSGPLQPPKATTSNAVSGLTTYQATVAKSKEALAPPSATPTTMTASESTQASMGKTDPALTPAQGLNPEPTPSRQNLDIGSVSDKNMSPTQAIRKAAAVVGMPAEPMITFAKVESSLDPNAGAKTSSAKGLFQITKPTWNELVGKQGARYGIPDGADIHDPYYNSLMGITYAKQNAGQAIPTGKQAGLAEEISLYLAHHFGPSGAKRLIEHYMKSPNAPVKDGVSSDAYSANRTELGAKTASQYIESLKAKMSKAANTPEGAYKGMKGQPSTPSEKASSDFVSSMPVATTYNAPATPAPTPSFTPPAPVAGQMTNTAGYTTAPSPEASSSPASIPTSPVRSQQPPQPSEVYSLDKNTEILNNQLSALYDIRRILEGIASGGSMRPASPMTAPPAFAASQSPAEPMAQPSSPQPSAAPIVAPNSLVPSTTSISMSRRPLT